MPLSTPIDYEGAYLDLCDMATRFMQHTRESGIKGVSYEAKLFWEELRQLKVEFAVRLSLFDLNQMTW